MDHERPSIATHSRADSIIMAILFAELSSISIFNSAIIKIVTGSLNTSPFAVRLCEHDTTKICNEALEIAFESIIRSQRTCLEAIVRF
jgi:hypothetical protein